MENITGDLNDTYQRYRMPLLEIKIQSDKTIILNLDDVSKSLNRDQKELLKSRIIGIQC